MSEPRLMWWSMDFVGGVACVVMGIAFAIGSDSWLAWYFGTVGGALVALFFANHVIEMNRLLLKRSMANTDKVIRVNSELIAQLARTQAQAMDVLTWKGPLK